MLYAMLFAGVIGIILGLIWLIVNFVKMGIKNRAIILLLSSLVLCVSSLAWDNAKRADFYEEKYKTAIAPANNQNLLTESTFIKEPLWIELDSENTLVFSMLETNKCLVGGSFDGSDAHREFMIFTAVFMSIGDRDLNYVAARENGEGYVIDYIDGEYERTHNIPMEWNNFDPKDGSYSAEVSTIQYEIQKWLTEM